MLRSPEPDDRSGEAMLVSHLDTIERIIAFTCRQHHVSTADADDFASHVKLKFVENDYAILRKFRADSSIRTYLTVVIQRLFLDFRISAWGKWRPSADAKRHGPTAILLEQLIVRDGYAAGEAFELLRTNHQVSETVDQLDALLARLPIRTKRRFESDDSLATVAADASADASLDESERRATADRVGAVLRSVMAELPEQDRLILVLRFEDGRAVAEIAKLLRLDQKPLYRRVDGLLRQLGAALEAAGVDAAAVNGLFESSAVSIDWIGPAGRESAAARPSLVKGAQRWR